MKYAVIIDAGSSGSRAYIYTWPDADSYVNDLRSDSVLRKALLPIETTQLWVNKVQPGISSFNGNTQRIWKDHLRPLLKKIINIIPKEEQHETPIYFLATAGLRLLPDEVREHILNEVCTQLQKKTRFSIPDCNSHVTMIDGQTEGLYGWLGLNYLIHWSLTKNWLDFSNTYGFLDMGGASAQLAFASSPDSPHKNDLHTVRIRTASGDPIEWNVFVTTWLGFGANQARSRFRDQLVAQLSDSEISEYENENAPIPVLDPCLPPGARDLAFTNSGKNCIFSGSGQWEECAKQVHKLLNAGVPCEDEPCLFDGVHVPDFTLADKKFVGVSEYWYTLQDLFQHNGKFDYQLLEPKVAELCGSNWDDIKSKIIEGDLSRSDGSPLSDDDIQKACFKSAWILTVLSKGFNFPLSPENKALHHNFQDTFQSAMEIEGTEISWTLGRAILYASSQITPSAGHENEPVGITTLSGEFIPGGNAFLSNSDNKGSNYGLVGIWIMIILVMTGLAVKFTRIGAKVARVPIVRRIRKLIDTWVPSVEQEFQERTASRIGYGNSYPHAGIPLTTFDIHEAEGVSTSRPPIQAPSRVGSRVSMKGYED